MPVNARQETVFDRIRRGCAAVADQAIHVRIRDAEIARYAMRLSASNAAVPPLDTEHHFVGDTEETLAFFVTLASVNFGSGYFPHLRKRSGLSGYFTVASSLADRFRAEGPIPAADLATLSADACAAIFGQDPRNEPIRELMGLFAEALNDLGRNLLDHFNGSFSSLIESANRSAARLIELLSEQAFFLDESPYGHFVVPFHKRSQLLASDLALAFASKGPGRFDDLDQLTIFADNLVPHVLRVDGLLLYSDELASAIDRGDLIPAGSPEEVEIRACAVHAVERIRDAQSTNGIHVSSRELDQILWHRGQRPGIKGAGKRHRTRTVFY